MTKPTDIESVVRKLLPHDQVVYMSVDTLIQSIIEAGAVIPEDVEIYVEKVRQLSLSTGHADTIYDLFNEVIDQIPGIQARAIPGRCGECLHYHKRWNPSTGSNHLTCHGPEFYGTRPAPNNYCSDFAAKK